MRLQIGELTLTNEMAGAVMDRLQKVAIFPNGFSSDKHDTLFVNLPLTSGAIEGLISVDNDQHSLYIAAQDAAHALEEFHALGYCHRDVSVRSFILYILFHIIHCVSGA